MYFFPDAEIEAILSEDIPYGDLTSRLLGLEGARGAVECFFKEEGVLAGAELAERLFLKAGLSVTRRAEDGSRLPAKTVFLRAVGRADRIHAVYKVAQNVMEYASGIATRTRAMVEAVRAVYSCETREEAAAGLDRALSWIMHSNVPEMKRAARSIRAEREGSSTGSRRAPPTASWRA